MENKRATSIRDIEVSERREDFNHNDKAINTENTKGVSYKAKNKKIWPKFVIFLFSIVTIFIFIFIFISFFFHSVSVEVNPKTEKITFSNDVYTAILFNEDSETGVIENVTGKISKGDIEISNNTEKSQNLREETRFQIGEGDKKVIYKIYNKITVAAGKSVIAEAFSDGSGEKYNKQIGTDLQIPGFKESNMTKEYKDITGKIVKAFETSSEETKTKEGDDPKTSPPVMYQVLELVAEGEQEIESIAIEEVSEKATGKITITNNTSKTQKLRKETRFGNKYLVFKTYKSVTIPSKESVTVDAFADVAGELYNIKKGTKFDIPGFEESEMDYEYKNISGVAETKFSGGMIGKKNIPNKEELADIKEELKKEVLGTLEMKIKSNKILSDFIVLGGDDIDKQYDFETLSVDDKVLVSMRAVHKIPMINKKDFISMIIKSEEITTEKIDQIEIKNFPDIEFKILNQNVLNMDSGDSFSFSVKGNAEISWILDEDLFIKSIQGNTVKEVEEKLSNSFKNFEFNISIFPFWRSAVPDNLNKIFIETK